MEKEYKYKYWVEATYTDGVHDSNATDDERDVIDMICHMVKNQHKLITAKVVRDGETLLDIDTGKSEEEEDPIEVGCNFLWDSLFETENRDGYPIVEAPCYKTKEEFINDFRDTIKQKTGHV